MRCELCGSDNLVEFFALYLNEDIADEWRIKIAYFNGNFIRYTVRNLRHVEEIEFRIFPLIVTTDVGDAGARII